MNNQADLIKPVVAEDNLPTQAEAIASAARQFKNSGITNAAGDARLLACQAFGIDGVELITKSSTQVTDQQNEAFRQLCERRMAGEPVGRMIGEKEFYGLTFALSKSTLEPRSDTETLVDGVLEDWQKTADASTTILELGTGTGAIITSLLSNLPGAKAVATDISQEALATARKNAQTNQVSERVMFIQTNWAEGLDQKFDIIVSNPPYIKTDIIATLANEVKSHDPHLALDGGADGLDAYREIFTQCSSKLASLGKLYLEIGYDQGESVRMLGQRAGWKFERLIKDIGKNDRVLVFRANI